MDRRRIPLMLRALLACATLLVLLAAMPASAQVQWNPPCSTITIFNKTSCTFNFTLATSPAGAIPTTSLTPGATITYPAPGGLRLNGVISAFGNFYPFPTTAPWQVLAVTMGPPDCCVDVFADPSTCTVTIKPSSGPFPCRD